MLSWRRMETGSKICNMVQQKRKTLKHLMAFLLASPKENEFK
jgi:hypothetical protein